MKWRMAVLLVFGMLPWAAELHAQQAKRKRPSG